MLTAQDRQVNETRIAELISKLHPLIIAEGFESRLENIGRYLINELTERNIRLKSTGEVADLSFFAQIVTQANDDELVDHLDNWLEQTKAQVLTETQIDIAQALRMQMDEVDWLYGSTNDFKKAQNSFIVETSAILKKGVTLQSPIDQNHDVGGENSLEALLRQRIKIALDQNFKKILIPILCEDLTWRLIIIDADKKKNITKVTLWDSIFDMNALYDPFLFRKRPLKIKYSTVFKSLVQATKNTNVIPQISEKINHDIHLSMDYVARKAFKLAFTCKKQNELTKRFFRVPSVYADITGYGPSLRKIIMGLILKYDPVVAPVLARTPSFRHLGIMSQPTSDPKGKTRVEGPFIEPINGPKLNF